jgi:oligopeptide transport system substrate-binding protein
LILRIVLLLFLGAVCASASSPPFRLHLSNEPTSLKPWEQKNSSAGYFLSQISGTLLTLDDGVLSPSLAEKCFFKSDVSVDCKIRTTATFSDGTPITADDFRKTWIEFLRPENHAYRADLLFSIKNAEKFFLGQVQEKDLGLTTKNGHLLISLEKRDPDFLFTLISPLLGPLKTFKFPTAELASKWITSGNYFIKSWEPQKKITLRHRSKDLEIEFLFIQEETTALNLYEKGELSFLRRLPTIFIPKYRTRKDFFQVPQVRMDYVGFGPELSKNMELRQALSHSLDFAEIQKLLYSKGKFGCPGLPESTQQKVHCVEFNLPEAKKQLALAKKKSSPLPHLSFSYSKQGGEDHKLVAEWLQSQWKKNLGIDVEVSPTENKIFLGQLKQAPPPLFRKGINPERPTCLSALEFFTPQSSENFLRLSPIANKDYFKVLTSLQKNPPNSKSRQLCSEALEILSQQSLWIPTGPIHFTLLAKPDWTGWRLNELNQLDLSRLKYSPSPR